MALTANASTRNTPSGTLEVLICSQFVVEKIDQGGVKGIHCRQPLPVIRSHDFIGEHGAVFAIHFRIQVCGLDCRGVIDARKQPFGQHSGYFRMLHGHHSRGIPGHNAGYPVDSLLTNTQCSVLVDIFARNLGKQFRQ